MIARRALSYRTNYPTANDRAEIENYIATAKARRAALEEVRRVVVPTIDAVIARMRAAYPEFARFHAAGFEKGHRDLVLVTNMAANSMFLGEHQTYDEMFAEWYRKILKAVHISPQFLRDTFTAWIEELDLALSAETFALLKPHAQHLADYLTQVPVPAKDETGRRLALPAPKGVRA